VTAARGVAKAFGRRPVLRDVDAVVVTALAATALKRIP
jgi:hypothetical protein